MKNRTSKDLTTKAWDDRGMNLPQFAMTAGITTAMIAIASAWHAMETAMLWMATAPAATAVAGLIAKLAINRQEERTRKDEQAPGD